MSPPCERIPPARVPGHDGGEPGARELRQLPRSPGLGSPNPAPGPRLGRESSKAFGRGRGRGRGEGTRNSMDRFNPHPSPTPENKRAVHAAPRETPVAREGDTGDPRAGVRHETPPLPLPRRSEGAERRRAHCAVPRGRQLRANSPQPRTPTRPRAPAVPLPVASGTWAQAA